MPILATNTLIFGHNKGVILRTGLNTILRVRRDHLMVIHTKMVGPPGAEPMQSKCWIQGPDFTKPGWGEGPGPRKPERPGREMDVEIAGYGSDPGEPMINTGFS